MADDSEATKHVLAKAYEDSLQEGLKELSPGFRAWGAQLCRPLVWTAKATEWTLDKAENAVKRMCDRLGPKIENIPEEEREAAHPAFVRDTVEQCLLHDGDDLLAEAFAQLLASSLDRRTSLNAHPSFVSLLKDLAPDEALIVGGFAHSGQLTNYWPIVRLVVLREDEEATVVRYFGGFASDTGCKHADLEPEYLENLIRLGLLEASSDLPVAGDAARSKYADLTKAEFISSRVADVSKQGAKAATRFGWVRLTHRGVRFCNAVFAPKAPLALDKVASPSPSIADDLGS